VTVDLGYLVNAGFSDQFGSNVDSDNQFSIKVFVQMGDAVGVTANNFTNYLYLSVKLGDVIVVGELQVFFFFFFFAYLSEKSKTGLTKHDYIMTG
jgi:hypothetical protein